MAIITGTSKGETLTGTVFADSIIGAGGNDILLGRGGDDLLAGWKGDDQLSGGLGNDTMAGGRGNDTYSVDNAGDQVIELANKGTDTVRTTLLSYALGSNLENLAFVGSGSFIGTGNSRWNVITGRRGDDVLDGREGNDRLIGGNGRDRLAGGDGNDTMDGGSGRDRLFGGKNDDTLFGRDFDDKLDSGSGKDALDGGAGDDTLFGGSGNDMIEGGSGKDTATFSGFKGDYSIVNIDGKIEVIDQNLGDGNDGIDLLSGVEILQFKDGKLPPPPIIIDAIDLATLDGTNGFRLSGADANDFSGVSVSSAGDVNGDGFADLIVGAPDTDLGTADVGQSYVIYGKAGGLVDIDLAALTPGQGFKLSGGSENDRAGQSVSTAGDVNGDGFDDVIVSAPFTETSATDAGKTFVIYGNASATDLDLAQLTSSQGFSISGFGTNGYSGLEVSLAGDINDDGIDDVIVGSHMEQAYVVYGQLGGQGNVDLATLRPEQGFKIFHGTSTSDDLGSSVSAAGDVNGDGIDDVIVGAPSASPNGIYDSGESYVIYGKSGGLTDLDLETMMPEQGFRIASAFFFDASGAEVSSAGDVNGDEIDDLIISAPAPDPFVAARAYVVYGKEGGLADINLGTFTPEQGFLIASSEVYSAALLSLSSAGDVNGDGLDDLIVSEHYADPAGRTDAGQSYVVYGRQDGLDNIELATMTLDQGFKIAGAAAGDNSGTSVSGAGDIDGDGFDDLIVGAPHADPFGRFNAGESYVIYGGNFTGVVTQLGTDADDVLISSGNPDEVLVGGLGNDLLVANDARNCIGGAGDDVIVVDVLEGTPRQADGGNGVDTIQADNTFPLTDLTEELRDRFNSIEIFDLTGTIANRLILDSSIVAHLSGSNGVAFGANTLLVQGDSEDFVTLKDPGWVKGENVVGPYGKAGTYETWTNGAATVLAELELGISANNLDLAEVTPAQGSKIAGTGGGNRAGDVNADGIDDLIVNAGQAQVIYGKAGGLGDIDVSALTPADGFKIAGAGAGGLAGDLNGDGIDDFILRNPGASPFGRPDAGESYVIYGKAGGTGDLDVGLLTPEQGFRVAGAMAGDNSGSSVDQAGDINGDGIDDIIIGAKDADPFGRYNASEAYVIYGKVGGVEDVDLAALTAAHGFKISGNDIGNRGLSVSGAGDINGDGIDDVIFGTTDGASGFAQVIFGKRGGLAGIDLDTVTSSQGFGISGTGSYDTSGWSVSDAGDVNGDGIEDLLVGSNSSRPFNRHYAGESYVIYGREGGPGDIELSTLTPAQGFKISGGTEYDFTGSTVSGVGDFNGDGFDDVLVSGPSAYLVFGREGQPANIDLAALDVTLGFKIYGAGAISGAGDIDGDGFADLLVGAGAATAFVIYGSDVLGGISHLGSSGDDTLTGTNADETFVGRLGNDVLTGGGGADAFQGGPGDDEIILGAGDLVRVAGGNGIDSVVADGFGAELDLTSDLRARFQDIETVDLGGLTANTLILDRSNVAHLAGSNGTIAGANTLLVKGDAEDQVRFADLGWIESGVVSDPHGQIGTYTSWKNGAVTALIEIDVKVSNNIVDLAALAVAQGSNIFGSEPGDQIGLSLRSAGDFNGDGHDDVIIGASFADRATGVDVGESYIIYGAVDGIGDIDLAALTAAKGFKIAGIAADDRSGGSVSSAGDVNGDGFDDVVVGAMQATPAGRTWAGQSYVIYGNATGSNDIDLAALTPAQGVKISGALDYDGTGHSVSFAGDINHDGIDDLAIGAGPADPFGREDVGQVHVVFGKAGGLDDIDLAALTSAEGFKISGAGLYDNTGVSISSAGDIDGDGIDDLVIGANLASPFDRTYAGQVFVIYGKEGGPGDIDLLALTEVQGFKLSGATENDLAGRAVSTAGDVNGDGIVDIILGALDAEGLGREHSGQSYVIYGEVGGLSDIDLGALTASQGFTISGSANYDASGASVSSAGDVNGDGLDDLIVGAPGADVIGREGTGQSYVIFGKESGVGDIDLATLTAAQGIKLVGASADDGSGLSVSAAGDVDGDGYADLFIASPRADPLGRDAAGQSYVFHGGDFSNAVTHQGTAGNDTLTGTTAPETFVGGLGDDVLNGGGGADAFRGGAGDDEIVLGVGDPSRVNGGSGIDSVQADQFGAEFDLTGHLRARFQNIEIVDLRGSQTNTLVLDPANVAQHAGSNGNSFGANTLLVNLDDEDEVSFADAGWVESGLVAHPFGQFGAYTSWAHGALTVLIQSDIEVGGGNIDLAAFSSDQGFVIDSGGLGGIPSNAGDVNGDGFDDVIVGFNQDDAFGRGDAGVSYVIFGKAGGPGDIDLLTLTAAQGFKIAGAAEGDNSGLAVSDAGDVNGDGYGDLIVGAPVADPFGRFNAGESFVVYGSANGPGNIDLATLTPAQGSKIAGVATADLSGSAVSAAGDLNGDGIDDLVIAAPEADPFGGDFAGQTYVVFGKIGGIGDIDLAALKAADGFKISGAADGDSSGASVSVAGDINGDGIADLVLGAPNADPLGRSYAGQSYVIFGAQGGPGDIDLGALTPDQGFKIAGGGGQTGVSVSTAGDVNGDGVADIVIGASDAGAYVVYGQDGAPADIDLAALTAAQGFKISRVPGDNPGSTTVSGAGDVNGDGIDDIIIGAVRAAPAGEYSGQSYVIYGKAGGLSDIDLASLTLQQGFKIDGASAYSLSGSSVSTAGDIDGDGFDDVVVSAPGGGKSYVIHGGDFSLAVTHHGTSDDDTLTGTEVGDDLVGGLGNDHLAGGGGADIFHGGTGDDEIHVADQSFRRVDGGGGQDVLHLDYAGLIDLGDIDNETGTADHTKVQNIETIDVDNGFSNQVELALSDVLELDAQLVDLGGVATLDDVLKIDGDAGDSLTLDSSDGWSAADTATLADYAIYAAGNVKIAVDQDIAVSAVA